MAVFIGKNNSKKISELKPRDIITTYKQNSWIPVAQYDHRIGSYTNLAINLDAITDYGEAYAYSLMQSTIDTMQVMVDQLNPDEWIRLLNVGHVYNPGYITEPMSYAVAYSTVAQNLTTYAFSYTSYLHGWHYLFGKYEKSIDPRPEYIYTDLEEYILTEDGRMLTI